MKKQLSIKVRITLWFAIFMILLAALALAFVLLGGNTLLKWDAEDVLVDVVERNTQALGYHDGQLALGEDFQFYTSGVYTVIYDRKGVYLAGQVPVGVSVSEPLEEGKVRLAASSQETYAVYDRKVVLDDHEHLWLRGIALEEGAVNMAHVVARLAVAALPFLLLLAVAGGYLLAKRALAPVERISRAAASINEGRDLSARIALPPGEDEMHQLAETFDSMFARLERSFEAEKQFTANASHELRTPLAVILAQCDALEKNAQTEEDYQEGVRVIQRQAGKMSRLVGELLSLSRLDRGVEKAHLEWTDLGELAEVICEQMRMVKERPVTVEAEADCLAWADAGLIARALENLLDNAFKYGRPEGMVWVSVKKAEDAVLLAVRDEGPGIAAEQLERIWERFYQADASRGEDGGMGLGLAMVQQIVRLHGGQYGVESIPGEGSTFWLRLPIEAAAALQRD